ncbi:MAG: putative zinc-binding metallopeptidase [Deltaproteobacteria bacterium]|nr:putative zinc-binding metallopeptidase [Deltaproteobacteria bacterium]
MFSWKSNQPARWMQQGASRLELVSLSVAEIERVFNRVREELWEVGLLEDGKYLDLIGCDRNWLPSFDGTAAEFYDEGVSRLDDWLGFEEGMIYLRPNARFGKKPGETLLDTMRHEFGHAWAWRDPAFFERRWFRACFGAAYDEVWCETPAFDRTEYISVYATKMPKEDFAETFMTFLRCRNTLHRFDRRPGVRAKLAVVEQAIKQASETRLARFAIC